MLFSKIMAFKKILVPLDGSKNSFRALDKAIELAKQCKATVVGLYVMTDVGLFTAVHAIKINEDKWSKKTKSFMDLASEKSKRNQVPFEATVIAGRTAGYDIVLFGNGKRNKIDLIIIGSRGISFAREIFLGSTSNFVLHKSKVPVTIVK
jgi:nucleotide-binding universal stress UspA family protein